MIEVDFEDLDTMAKTMWGECRGCDTEGQIGVANVINNRVNARRWYGKTHKEVCLKEWQFSCWNEGDPNKEKMEQLSRTDPIYIKMLGIGFLVMSGKIKDNTQNSTHYHTKAVKPKWSYNVQPVCEYGEHLFYNNVI